MHSEILDVGLDVVLDWYESPTYSFRECGAKHCTRVNQLVRQSLARAIGQSINIQILNTASPGTMTRAMTMCRLECMCVKHHLSFLNNPLLVC